MNRNWSCSHNDSALRNRWLATAIGIPGLRSPMVSLPPGKNGDVAQRSFSADGAWKQCRVPLQLCGRIGLSAAHDARRVLSQVCTLIPGKRFKRARFVVAMATVSPGWRAGVAWPARMASASRASGDDVGMPDNKRVGNRSCPPSGELPPKILRSGPDGLPAASETSHSPRPVARPRIPCYARRMRASRGWQGITSRIAKVAKGLAVKLRPWRAREAMPAMIGTPPSKRSLWHDPAEHARDFAERYADPMNYHVESRM